MAVRQQRARRGACDSQEGLMVSRNPLSSRPSLPRNVTIQYQGDNARARALTSKITGTLTGDLNASALHTHPHGVYARVSCVRRLYVCVKNRISSCKLAIHTSVKSDKLICRASHCPPQRIMFYYRCKGSFADQLTTIREQCLQLMRNFRASNVTEN